MKHQLKIKVKYFPSIKERKNEHPTMTRVEIYNEDKLIAQGSSGCSKKDNFNYATGRKYAFQRAVETIKDKRLRKALWEKLIEISPKTVIAKTHHNG